MTGADQRIHAHRAILMLFIASATMTTVPLRPVPASAAGVVGTGTPESCTDAALDAALAGGGLVTFNCGAAPVTIDLRPGPSSKRLGADTTIDGGGLITISARNSSDPDAVFLLRPEGTLTIRNLTIADARRGGIDNFRGTVSVTASTFTGNTGPGVHNLEGTLSVAASTFASNSGPGIMNENGSATVRNSMFTNTNVGIYNVLGQLAVTDSTFSEGGVGGINNQGTLVVGDSTFTRNSGSGISNYGTLTVTNSTFVGNGGGSSMYRERSSRSLGEGSTAEAPPSFSGGIVQQVGIGTVTNCTFVDNIPWNIEDFGTMTATNSILAIHDGNNCYTHIIDLGHNIEDDESCGFSAANRSLSNTDAGLDPAGLADNGGPTQTIALLPDSAAVDSGDPGVCAAAPVDGRDQRGYVRPGVGHSRCSIGAYEAGAIPVAACIGDCSGDGTVAIDELIIGVDIALGVQPRGACPAFMNPDGRVDVAQVIAGVNHALGGCGTSAAN